MILLDTNVVSEMMRREPDSAVSSWLNKQDKETLYLSGVTLAELLAGVIVLPDGKRKRELEAALDRTLQMFGDRILPFDKQAARHYAELLFAARKSGRGFPVPDGYVAAIAASREFAVATRDTAPYLAGGIKVINPWVEG